MDARMSSSFLIDRQNGPEFLNRISLFLLMTITVNILCLSTSSAEFTQFTGKDVTPLLFGEGKFNEEVFPLAFGDFNADKRTDVFAVQRNFTGPNSSLSTLLIYFAQEEEPLLRLAFKYDIVTETNGTKLPVNIVGISPGDFNGDGLLDAMITYKPVGINKSVEILICRGNLKELNCGDEDFPPQYDELVQEPLITDVNGDMVMDLVGERWVLDSDNKTEFKQKSLWLFHPGNAISFSRFDLKVTVDPPLSGNYPANYSRNKVTVTNPSSMAIVDVNGDTIPELVIVTQNDSDKSHPYFFIEYYRIGAQVNETHWDFMLFQVISLNDGKVIQVIGQPIYMDLNQDGILRHILPYCRDHECKTSGFKVISMNETKPIHEIEILANIDRTQNSKWSFLKITPNNSSLLELHEFYSKALTFRVGDYNMDGYPDLIGTLMEHEGPYEQKEYRAVIFENVPCVNLSSDPCDQQRSFRINVESLAEYTNVAMATFYDIYEDGLLDVLLVRKSRNNTKEAESSAALSKKHMRSHYGTFGFLSNPDYDANFLKVVVTTGRSCPQCPHEGIPYGNILPGPVIKYFTSTQEGDDVKAIGAQMYRSSNIPLDLPYVFFGIGHSPNFIESLDVSLSTNESRKKNHKWTQLIPNSQIIILPYEGRYDGASWKAKIFLPSNKAALHTFGVLVGFCGLVAFIILFLHWKERREDRKERLLESHRFHMM